MTPCFFFTYRALGICTTVLPRFWHPYGVRKWRKKTFPVPWVETVESNIGKKDTACKNGKVHMNLFYLGIVAYIVKRRYEDFVWRSLLLIVHSKKECHIICTTMQHADFIFFLNRTCRHLLAQWSLGQK